MTDILWLLFEIAVNLFQGTIISHYAYSILDDKHNRSFVKSGGLITSLILTVTITAINYLIDFEGLYLCTYILVVFIYTMICLKGQFLKKLFISSFSIIFISIVTILVANFFALLFNEPVSDIFANQTFERFISVIVCQLIILYIYKVTLGLFKNENRSDLTNNEWILIISVLFISIIVSLFLAFIAMQDIPNNARLPVVLSVLGIIIINIATVYLVINLSKKNSIVRENQLLRIQQMYQSQYMENAQNQYEAFRKVRHEFKNHYVVIATLLEQGDYEKAKKYVDDNFELINTKDVVINTNNSIFNAVINSKIEIAKSYDIDVSIDTINQFEGISDLDLCSLISNMFENAIEACQKVKEKRQIIFSAKSQGSGYLFSIKNTIENSILEKNPTLSTTKKDKENHGLGVKVIKDIAQKYNGMADFFEDEHLFICNIKLNIK